MSARRFALGLLAGSALLTGCGARAEREALRSCTFSPSGVATTKSGDSLTVSVSVAISNPGTKSAILDSFSGIASGGRPLARLSHGSTLRIKPGETDTAVVHLRIAEQGLLATGLALAFSPPDSVLLEGNAWVPGFFGGLSAHPIRLSVPWSRVAPGIRSLVPTP